MRRSVVNSTSNDTAILIATWAASDCRNIMCIYIYIWRLTLPGAQNDCKLAGKRVCEHDLLLQALPIKPSSGQHREDVTRTSLNSIYASSQAQALYWPGQDHSQEVPASAQPVTVRPKKDIRQKSSSSVKMEELPVIGGASSRSTQAHVRNF